MKNLKEPEFELDQSGRLWTIIGKWKIGVEQELSSCSGFPEVDDLLDEITEMSDDDEKQVTHAFERCRTVTLTKKELLEVTDYGEDEEVYVDKEDDSFSDLVWKKLDCASYDCGDEKYTYQVHTRL